MASPILQHIGKLVAIETASQVSDAALLERFVARRDESAFAHLLKRHGPMVLRLGRRLLGQEQDAEDIFQSGRAGSPQLTAGHSGWASWRTVPISYRPSLSCPGPTRSHPGCVSAFMTACTTQRAPPQRQKGRLEFLSPKH
jgi:hypothetical protein